MILLSERLKTVAEMVNFDSVSDIGTDHGKLPVYLVQSGKVKFAIASDINEGPVEACRRTVEKFNLSDKINIRRSDGLENFAPFETKTLCIAGMGGELIFQILKSFPEKTNSFEEIVLQPMTQTERLKKCLFDNGFVILDETLAKEKNKIYDVIKVKKTNNKVEYKYVDLFFSDKLLQKKDDIFTEYKNKIIKKILAAVEGIKKSSAADENEIEFLMNVLKEVESVDETEKDNRCFGKHSIT